MTAIDGQQAFGGEVSPGERLVMPSAVSHVRATGFLVDGFALDPKDLRQVGKVEVVVECGATPNAPGFDAAMIGRGDLDKVGLSAVWNWNAISRSSVGWLPLTVK